MGCLRASSSRQDEAAAAAALQAAVACKQRAAAGVLAKLSPSPPGQAKGKPAQAQQADAQQAQHDQLIKAVTAPGIPAQPWGASSAAVSPSVPPSSTQQGAAQATEVDEPSGDYSLQQGPQREQASLQSAAPASFGALAGAAAVEGAPPVVLEQEQQIENMEQDAQAPLDSPMVPCLLGARSAPSPCAEQQHPQSALQPLHDLGAQRQEPIECEEQQAASQQEQQHGQEEQRPQHEQQQPQQPQQQQPQQPQQPPHEGMQQAPSLPGPAISVELAAVGRRRGRGKPPAQEYDFCTSDGTFVDSGSGKPANPLAGLVSGMAGLPARARLPLCLQHVHTHRGCLHPRSGSTSLRSVLCASGGCLLALGITSAGAARRRALAAPCAAQGQCHHPGAVAGAAHATAWSLPLLLQVGASLVASRDLETSQAVAKLAQWPACLRAACPALCRSARLHGLCMSARTLCRRLAVLLRYLVNAVLMVAQGGAWPPLPAP